MGVGIALGLFGVLLGAAIRNRLGAVFAAAAASFVAWMGLPAAQPFLAGSATGRRIAEMLSHNGAEDPSLFIFLGASAAGVLLAWMLFGGSDEHRPDWEWDPEHPKSRKRRRRRAWVG